MNARKFDEIQNAAELRFARRMANWQEKWLGDRVSYGQELGSDVFAGNEPGSFAEAGETSEAEMEPAEEEEDALYLEED